MSSFSAALHSSSRRLTDPLTIAGVILALCLAVFVTFLERRLGPGAVDRSLTGIAFGLALPLVAFSIVKQSCRSGRLDTSFSELARHGADRRKLALGQLAATSLTCAGVGTLLGVLTVVAARGFADPHLAPDLGATAWIGALAGAAYACWFTAGSSFGKRGGGRTAFLVLDWTFGSSSSALSLLLPRGHVLNLLGASPPLGIGQSSSFLLLALVTFFALGLAIYRIPR